ncbi:MAG: DNA-directed RNA polymerase subunit omega [Christensenellales bacterium]|jgi:DNA-directed RNA polymerase omega subunit
MIDPPVDKLIEKSKCRFALVCVVAKRAKELLALEEEALEKSNCKAITYAAKEFYEDKIKFNY